MLRDHVRIDVLGGAEKWDLHPRHFVGTGPSPGSIGASIPLLIVLFAHSAWPLWLRLILAPVVAAFEFSWVAAYWLLQRFFPRPR
jgi:hypothetical protein